MARKKADLRQEEKEKKWDDRYLDLANLVRGWSKDPNAKVGAVIVNSDRGRLISVGFNGFPSNVEDNAERLQNKDVKLSITIHAEQNALIFAGQQALGCDAYVVGKPVCSMCATLLIQAGIKRVIATKPRKGTESKWDKVGLLALAMFEEAGIEFKELTEDDLDRLKLDTTEARDALPPSGAIIPDQPELFS